MKFFTSFSFLIVWLLIPQASFAFETLMEVSQQELQNRVEKMFPLQSEALVVKLIMRNPKVSLHPKKNRMGLEIHFDVYADDKIVGSGQTFTEGRLTYKSETGEFFLFDSHVQKLESAQLDPQIQPLVRDLVNEFTGAILEQYPVYVLDENDLRQKFLRKRLISVEVQEGKLIAKFDM